MRYFLAGIFTLLFSTITNANVTESKKDTLAESFSKKNIFTHLEPKEKPLKISADCKVFIDGKEATLKDLKNTMELKFTIKDNIIIVIDATTDKP